MGIRRQLFAVVGTAALTAAGIAVAAMAQMPAPATSPARPIGAGDDDARRASAARLLSASRFRERQAVVLPDSIRAARADLVTECVDRAAAGRSLGDCRATAGPGSPADARLAAKRADMLDEIMAASQAVYARRFTSAEMDEITRFFRTPVGRKYGDLYPQVIADVQARRAAITRRYLIEASRSTNR